MAILRRIVQGENGPVIGYTFWCPACDGAHAIYTAFPGRTSWQFNGDEVHPTFTPSLLIYENPAHGEYPGHPRCHSFIRNGSIEYCPDSTHKMAGQTVPLPEWNP